MWWHERRASLARMARVALTLAAPVLLGGCFEPLYAERTLSGGPGLGQKLSGVKIAPIDAPSATPEARIANTLRNELIFALTGGSEPPRPTHQLKVQLSSLRQQLIVDLTTARPDVEMVGVNAYYTLTEIGTGRAVVTGSAFARSSYDIPGQQQRFAGARGQLDAQERAAKIISENIRSRLASYFAAGT
jgi:LPS-assembly lipoprotein